MVQARKGQPLLEVRDLVAGYGKSTVLHGVSFSIAAGERVALLGRNGAGKSTLLLAISGLIPIQSGSVHLAGQDITKARSCDIVASGLIHVLQGHRVFGPLSVEDNLRISLRREDRGSVAETVMKKAWDLFPELSERRHLPASRLSGGQQQMLAVSQGVVSRPALLMLDEPSYGLAPVVVDRIFNVVREIAAAGTGVLVVEQLVSKTLRATENCFLLAGGKIAHSAASSELLDNETVQKLYFG